MQRKETLYFDVDGVLLDFNAPFIAYWHNHYEVELNAEIWTFGYYDYKFSIHEADRLKAARIGQAFDNFNLISDPLPLMHKDIPSILTELKSRYFIELVTGYPDEKKRIADLNHHNILYDKLSCGVHDKLSYIKSCEERGAIVAGIFEDGPNHLEKFSSIYSNRIWAPRCWSYLKSYENHPDIRLYHSPCEWRELY